MSDSSINEAVVAASEPEITAVSEPEQQGTPGEQEAPKTFTQEELDKIVGERLAKERRKIEREQAQSVEDRRPTLAALPQPAQFNTEADYAEALINHRAEEIANHRENQKRRVEVESTYADREEDARVKYDDFQQVAYNPDLRITPEMAEVIKASDLGPEIAYHLGSNPKEALRISQMLPLSQARELGRIEANLTTSSPVKKSSSAPAPINPVGSRSTTPTYDTTDPRSTKTMSDSEWIKAENARRSKL